MSVIYLPLPDFAWRFDLLLAFLKRFAYPARMMVRDEVLWRVTAGHLLSYRLAEGAVAIQGPRLSVAQAAQVYHASQVVLGLKNDLGAFYDAAQRDEQLWRIIEPVHGLPVLCTETVFEALITLIIEQHITWKSALRAQRSLMEILDTGHALGDERVYDFPSPPQLAQATREQLKALKITNRRLDLIIHIARECSSGRLEFESLRHRDAESVYQQLVAMKGVGHWTAGNVIARALGQFPTISHNDVALQAAIRHYFYADTGRKGPQQVIETLQAYGEYAGLVGHFVLSRWVLDRYPPLD